MTVIGLAQTHATMAGRQKALWFTAIPLTAFATLLAVTSPAAPAGGINYLVFTGQITAIFTGVAHAAAFTDFFTTSTRLGMHDIEAAAPVRPEVLSAARVIGTATIVIVPSALVLIVMGLLQTIDGNLWALPSAFAVGATIVLPAALVAITVSGLAGAILPRALSRIAAILMWFYLVFSTPLIPIPTLTGTIFNVVGDTVAEGYFGASPIYPPAGPLGFDGTPATATASLAWQLFLIIAMLATGTKLAERTHKR